MDPSMDGITFPLVATGQQGETVQSLVQGLVCLTSNQTQLDQRLLGLHALPKQAQLERELREGARASSSMKAANSELRLELLRWRKKVSIYRLKLASVEEDLRLHLDNANSQNQQLHLVLESNQDLQTRLEALTHEQGLSEASSSAHKEVADRLQAELTAANTTLQATQQQASHLEYRLSMLQNQHTSLLQQLEGAQVAAQAASKRGQELEASLAATQAELGQAHARNARLEQDLASAQAAGAALKEAAQEAEGRARVANEAKGIAECAITEWQRMAEERRVVMQEHEQQLLKLSQERMRLDTDRASATEAHLQAQLSMLQTTLDSETSKRQEAELQVQQLMLKAQATADGLHSRIRGIELQAATQKGRIQELEDLLLRQRATAAAALDTTSSDKLAQGLGSVDRLMQDLMPVPEDHRMEQKEQGCGRRGAPGSGSLEPQLPLTNRDSTRALGGNDVGDENHGGQQEEAFSAAQAIASRAQAQRARQQQQEQEQRQRLQQQREQEQRARQQQQQQQEQEQRARQQQQQQQQQQDQEQHAQQQQEQQQQQQSHQTGTGGSSNNRQSAAAADDAPGVKAPVNIAAATAPHHKTAAGGKEAAAHSETAAGAHNKAAAAMHNNTAAGRKAAAAAERKAAAAAECKEVAAAGTNAKRAKKVVAPGASTAAPDSDAAAHNRNAAAPGSPEASDTDAAAPANPDIPDKDAAAPAGGAAGSDEDGTEEGRGGAQEAGFAGKRNSAGDAGRRMATRRSGGGGGGGGGGGAQKHGSGRGRGRGGGAHVGDAMEVEGKEEAMQGGSSEAASSSSSDDEDDEDYEPVRGKGKGTTSRTKRGTRPSARAEACAGANTAQLPASGTQEDEGALQQACREGPANVGKGRKSTEDGKGAQGGMGAEEDAPGGGLEQQQQQRGKAGGKRRRGVAEEEAEAADAQEGDASGIGLEHQHQHQQRGGNKAGGKRRRGVAEEEAEAADAAAEGNAPGKGLEAHREGASVEFDSQRRHSPAAAHETEDAPEQTKPAAAGTSADFPKQSKPAAADKNPKFDLEGPKPAAPSAGRASQWGGSLNESAGVVNGGVTGVIVAGSGTQQQQQQQQQPQLPAYQPRITQNPLAALNSRVAEAAAVRRPYVALSAKEALKLASLRNEKQGAGSSKRKPAGEQGFAGDAAPHNMLMNTLMPPRVRQP